MNLGLIISRRFHLLIQQHCPTVNLFQQQLQQQMWVLDVASGAKSYWLVPHTIQSGESTQCCCTCVRRSLTAEEKSYLRGRFLQLVPQDDNQVQPAVTALFEVAADCRKVQAALVQFTRMQAAVLVQPAMRCSSCHSAKQQFNKGTGS
jgi:hypothetical protein